MMNPANSPDAQLEHARSLLKAGKRRQAERVIESLINEDAGNLPAWFLGVSLMETPLRKQRMLEACLKHNPDHPRVLQAIQSLSEGLAWNDSPPPPTEKEPTPIPLVFNDPVKTLRGDARRKKSLAGRLGDALEALGPQGAEHRLALGSLGLFVLFLVIAGSWAGIRAAMRSLNHLGGEVARDAQALCAGGEPVRGSTGYTQKDGPHPLAVIYPAGGSPPTRSEYPAGWLPAASADLQLVACVYPAEETIETCEYSTGPSVERIRSLLRVDLYNSRDAALLDRLLVFNDPQPCDETEDYETTLIKGKAPIPAQLFAEIERHLKSTLP